MKYWEIIADILFLRSSQASSVRPPTCPGQHFVPSVKELRYSECTDPASASLDQISGRRNGISASPELVSACWEASRGPPEPVSGWLERRSGRRNDSPVGRNESRGH